MFSGPSIGQVYIPMKKTPFFTFLYADALFTLHGSTNANAIFSLVLHIILICLPKPKYE